MSNRTKQSGNSDREPITYRIPVISREDVMLAATGARVTRATLQVGGNAISVIKPDSESADEKSITELNFLGSAPLRTGLVKERSALVLLQTVDDKIPSLMMHSVGATTYESLGADNFIEDVVVSTLAGVKKNRIIYFNGDIHLAIE
jgi:hypothetical protein